VFDIGISELLVIGIVALVVIGPERLPRVARTLGVLFGRLQRYVAQVKSDISREMEIADLGKVKTEFENAARGFKSDIEAKAAETERDLREAQTSIERELEGKSQDAPAPDPALAAPLAEPSPASPQLELGIETPPQAQRRLPAAP
jgi:sec-independent protein translocase protein TatB